MTKRNPPPTYENFIHPSRAAWMIAYCDRVLASPDLSPSIRREYLERKEYWEMILRTKRKFRREPTEE